MLDMKDAFEKYGDSTEEIELTEEDMLSDGEMFGGKDDVSVLMQLTMVDLIDFAREPFYVPENELFNFSELRNRYFVIRHGQSTANTRKVVVSDPKVGLIGYGLTDEGKRQIEESARKFLHKLKVRRLQLANVVGEKEAAVKLSMDNITKNNSIVLSSDFKRALETAEIFAKSVKLNPPKKAKALRERFFGNYDMREGDIYPSVWDRDAMDYAQTDNGVESVASVLHRSTKLVKIVESMHKGKNVFLVAHGDIGQILQTGFHKMDPRQHRKIQHLENAEIREMWINPLMQAA